MSLPLAILLSVILIDPYGDYTTKCLKGKKLASEKSSNSNKCSYFFTSVKRLLLILSGNVHKNPGPDYHDFSIIHINCRSLNKDKKTLIEAQNNNYEIITLSETWLKDTHTDEEIQMQGFHKPIRKDREDNRGYGGGKRTKRHTNNPRPGTKYYQKTR